MGPWCGLSLGGIDCPPQLETETETVHETVHGPQLFSLAQPRWPVHFSAWPI